MSNSTNRWLIRQAQRQRAQQLNSHQTTLVHMNASEFIDYAIQTQIRRGRTHDEAVAWVEDHLFQNRQPSPAWEEYRDRVQFYTSLTPIGLDAVALTALAKEMKRGGRLFSRYRIQAYRGVDYVIFEGYAGLREDLKGTRYQANNPKIVSMGIGKAGVKEVVKNGVIVSILISAGFHAIDQLMDDRKTWHHFVGGVAVDVGVAAVASGIAWGLTTLAIGTASVVAVGPLLAIVAVGSLAAYTINRYVDTSTISNRIADALIGFENNLSNMADSAKQSVMDLKEESHTDPVGFMHRLFGVPRLPI